jgi:hypothetical protein
VSDLVDFVLARIAEDEAAARSAAPSPWQYGDVASVAGGSLYDATVMIGSMHWDSERVDPHIRRARTVQAADANGRHIARWHPARVLRECEAKRRWVALHSPLLIEGGPVCRSCTPPRFPTPAYPCPTILAVALPYADHPDYRAEWRA